MIGYDLLELMKEFHLPQLILRLTHLTDAADMLDTIGDVPFQKMDEEDQKGIKELLQQVRTLCENIRFDHASQKAYTLLVRIDKLGFTKARDIGISLGDLKSDIEICMFAHSFVQIESPLVTYLEGGKLFGNEVLTSFPSASNDITDAGDSLAVGLNSAAVFHLMHVVEWGLRALAVDVGLLDIVTEKKTGKTIPMEYSEWERILQQLPVKIDAKIEAMPRGDAKQQAQEFYHPAALEIRGFKDAWRNHIMHTRASYFREDAVAVWSHVERFMKGLAAFGLKETL
jgi:hypothetical protein